VESVILAHTNLLLNTGHQVSLIAGNGNQAALPAGAAYIHIPQVDSRYPEVVQMNRELEAGKVPGNFEDFSTALEVQLERVLGAVDHVIVHNVLTKHFNLALTAAITRLLDRGKLSHCIAWCHDITWTSPHSRSSVHPGYPWDLLHTARGDVEYVAISKQRQAELAELFNCPAERIKVVYDGVDPVELYGLSEDGKDLFYSLGLDMADLILIMPVRITQAKNIEFAFKVTASLKSAGIRPKLVVTGPPDPHDPSEMEYYHQLLSLRQALGIEQEARFVYECDKTSQDGYIIGMPLLRQLYRACDALFVPSHREGFGMPILEAGLIGMPVFSTGIPAVKEIGNQEVYQFSLESSAEKVAQTILEWAMTSPTQKLRQRIRQHFTWSAIYQNDILPLLSRGILS
jgi:glycosyltransferase involved in cell wall biosynthesis